MSESTKHCPFCGSDSWFIEEFTYPDGHSETYCCYCGERIDKRNSSTFFRNTDCEYFPCHKTDNPENFSCLFCYCPLYHMAECPGVPEILPNGIKDCTNCVLPHYNYDTVIEALRKDMKL